jgi:hypothetical protein
MQYNKKAKTYFKVTCKECHAKREIYRTGKDNSKKFYCLECQKMVSPVIKEIIHTKTCTRSIKIFNGFCDECLGKKQKS